MTAQVDLGEKSSVAPGTRGVPSTRERQVLSVDRAIPDDVELRLNDTSRIEY